MQAGDLLPGASYKSNLFCGFLRYNIEIITEPTDSALQNAPSLFRRCFANAQQDVCFLVPYTEQQFSSRSSFSLNRHSLSLVLLSVNEESPY